MQMTHKLPNRKPKEIEKKNDAFPISFFCFEHGELPLIKEKNEHAIDKLAAGVSNLSGGYDAITQPLSRQRE